MPVDLSLFKASINARLDTRFLAVLAVLAVVTSAACSTKCRPGTVLDGNVCRLPNSQTGSAGAATGKADAAVGVDETRNGVRGNSGTSDAQVAPASSIGSSAGGSGGGSAQAETPSSGGSDAEPNASSGSDAEPNGEPSSDGAAPLASCGDNVVDGTEICDGNCPTECLSDTACVGATLIGSAATCDARCEQEAITACTPGDGCCGGDCRYPEDTDCSPSCGDGVLNEGETCEAADPSHPCPSVADCDDGDPCTRDELMGSAESCNAQCVSVPIVRPMGGDGCCPAGANANSDSDCSAMCGNRVMESGEMCDGNCPTSCPRGAGCQQQQLMGSADQCNSRCVAMTVTMRQDGDGCCPNGANATNDRDCPGCRSASECPRGETCNAGKCECPGTPSSTNREHCGSCGNACAADEDCVDGRCEERCGNEVVDSDEQCDESAPGWLNNGGACVNCRLTAEAYQACRAGGQDCWPNSSSVGWICSGTGACSRTCNGRSDCLVTGANAACVAAGRLNICVLQTCSECRRGTQCQFYGDEGDRNAVVMCGWVSVNTSDQPWCPHEYGTCVSPWGDRISHPCTEGPPAWPDGCMF